MVLEDDETQESQAVVILENCQVEQDLDGFGPREHRQPADDSAREEVRERRLTEAENNFAPSLVPAMLSTKSVADGIPTQSVGTRKLGSSTRDAARTF